METLDATEVADMEAPVRPMSPADIAKQQQATASAETQQIVQHPADTQNKSIFNQMSEKLSKAMQEVTAPKVDAKPEATEQAQPKTEVATDNKEPETFTSAKAADWKKLKADREEWQKKATELEQKHMATVKELEAIRAKAIATDPNPELQKQLDELRTEKEKYLQQLETVALERSERFTSAFQKVFDSSLARAKEAAGDNAEKIDHLIQLQPSKWRKERIQEVAETLSDMDRAALSMAITEYDRARADRDEALKNSRENLKKVHALDAEKSQREQQLNAARVEAAIKSVMEKARSREAFQIKEGQDAHNAAVKANEMEVDRFLRGQMSAEAIAEIPLDAIEGRRLRSVVLPELQKRLAEAEAALKEYQTAKPGTTGPVAKQQAKPTGGENTGERRPFMDQVIKNWGV